MHILRIGLCVIAVSGAAAVTSAALAQGRPSTTNMTCAQAQGMVKSAGAIVLGSGGMSYDRFVSNESFCTSQEIGVPNWVPARDNPQCFIGYVCEPRAGRDPTPP